MYWKRLIVNSLAIYLLVARLLISSLLKQVVIELNYAVAKGEAFCLYGIGDFTHCSIDVRWLEADEILSYHISLLMPLLYLCVWLLAAKPQSLQFFYVIKTEFDTSSY